MNSTASPPVPAQRTGLALAALFLGTFVLGSAELLVVGVLNGVARDMSVTRNAAVSGLPGEGGRLV